MTPLTPSEGSGKNPGTVEPPGPRWTPPDYEAELDALLGAVGLAALKAWLTANGLSIVKLTGRT